MINGKNFFDTQYKVTYENNRKITANQEHDYTAGCLLDYAYFRNKMIAIDLSKQQTLDANHKAIQQINFTANLYTTADTRIYFILEEAKELS